MATSGDKTWSVNRDQIIASALRKIGEYDSLDGVPNDERDDASMALNALVKEWTGEGIGLWLRERDILILNKNTQRYSLGPSGTTGTVDNFHCFRDTELIENTILADEAAAQTTISIDDSTWVDFEGQSVAKTDLADGDNIGIRQDDGTIHWDTIATAAAGADVVDITNGLASAASAGRKVYTYTTRISRPAKLLYAQRETTSGSASQIDIVGRVEYERLSLKSSSGEPTKALFDPQLDNVQLSLWPVKNPMSVDKVYLTMTYYADDFDAAADNPEFPVEWANALIWNLALELCFEYGVDIQTRAQLKAVADEKKFILLNTSDVENADVRFGMDYAGVGHRA